MRYASVIALENSSTDLPKIRSASLRISILDCIAIECLDVLRNLCHRSHECHYLAPPLPRCQSAKDRAIARNSASIAWIIRRSAMASRVAIRCDSCRYGGQLAHHFPPRPHASCTGSYRPLPATGTLPRFSSSHHTSDNCEGDGAGSSPFAWG